MRVLLPAPPSHEHELRHSNLQPRKRSFGSVNRTRGTSQAELEAKKAEVEALEARSHAGAAGPRAESARGQEQPAAADAKPSLERQRRELQPCKGQNGSALHDEAESRQRFAPDQSARALRHALCVPCSQAPS